MKHRARAITWKRVEGDGAPQAAAHRRQQAGRRLLARAEEAHRDGRLRRLCDAVAAQPRDGGGGGGGGSALLRQVHHARSRVRCTLRRRSWRAQGGLAGARWADRELARRAALHARPASQRYPPYPRLSPSAAWALLLGCSACSQRNGAPGAARAGGVARERRGARCTAGRRGATARACARSARHLRAPRARRPRRRVARRARAARCHRASLRRSPRRAPPRACILRRRHRRCARSGGARGPVARRASQGGHGGVYRLSGPAVLLARVSAAALLCCAVRRHPHADGAPHRLLCAGADALRAAAGPCERPLRPQAGPSADDGRNHRGLHSDGRCQLAAAALPGAPGGRPHGRQHHGGAELHL